MTKHSLSISIVVPLYNEQDNVIPLLDTIESALKGKQFDYQVILVNDGSSDRTAQAVRNEINQRETNIRLIDLQRNFGQTAAMQAGIDASQGELIVTMDGDLQNDPHDIPRMVDELLERDLDMLQGWRFNRQDSLYSRKIPSRIANYLIQRITGVKLHDYGCSLKIYRAAILKQIRLYGEMHRFIPVWLATVTSPHRIGETRVDHHARRFGESKYGISRTFRVIIDLLTVFFFMRYQARPGHFFGSLGLLCTAIAMALFTHLGVVKFILGEDIGQRPMLLTAVFLFITGIQLLMTGVLSETLSRLLFQTRQHKSYVVREDVSSGTESDNNKLQKQSSHKQ